MKKGFVSSSKTISQQENVTLTRNGVFLEYKAQELMCRTASLVQPNIRDPNKYVVERLADSVCFPVMFNEKSRKSIQSNLSIRTPKGQSEVFVLE